VCGFHDFEDQGGRRTSICLGLQISQSYLFFSVYVPYSVLNLGFYVFSRPRRTDVIRPPWSSNCQYYSFLRFRFFGWKGVVEMKN
jgi:hypothetical protein